ncbi:hypothetical protein [Actinomadura sp. DC4]|nr:hypothetical protein [Actinomadura sp. DC4]MDN3353545.1 hypothetical protein [Actinomadura sp. DC4]
MSAQERITCENLLAKVPESAHRRVATPARTIFDQPAAEEARHARARKDS